MTPTHAPLHDRIRDFPIDAGQPAFTFADRLARENGWPPDFARRVIAEYRRFLFLAMTAGHPVTPSAQVDEAWHLHLTFTRSYWDRLCGEVLGRPLHHEPTEGGPRERDKFFRQYEQTLRSYRESFAEDPPADIWPPAAIRFGSDLHVTRVNTDRNWVVPKSAVRRGLAAAAAAVALSLLVGCARPVIPVEYADHAILALVVPGVLAVLLAGRAVRDRLRGPGPHPEGAAPDLNWADAAYLSVARRGGGSDRLLTAALARLAVHGALRVSGDGQTIESTGSAPGTLSAVERTVLRALPLTRTDRAARQELSAQVKSAFARRAGELRAEGYVVAGLRRMGAGALAYLLMLIIGLGMAIALPLSGVLTGPPTGWLNLGVLAVLVLGLPTAFGISRRTRRGRYVLSRLRRDHHALRSGHAWAGSDDAGMAVALFGTTVLAGSAWDDLAGWFPHPTGESSSGCGTGCGTGGGDGGCGGGGCGGGGCGGCGGCGG